MSERTFTKDKTTITTTVPAEAVRLIAQGWEEVPRQEEKPRGKPASKPALPVVSTGKEKK